MEALYRFEIFCTVTDFRGEGLMKSLNNKGRDVTALVASDNYLINAALTPEEAKKAASALTNPVTQDFLINSPYIPERFDYAVQIGFLPGVTDNAAHTVRESIEDLLKKNLDHERGVFSSVTWFFECGSDINLIASELYNPLIQTANIKTRQDYISSGGMGNSMPVVNISNNPDAGTVSLNVSDEELAAIGREGIAENDRSRRGPLALDMPSLKAIKKYFHETEKRDPFDIELESIAQTWSEHCKHTIFAASIDDIHDGIYKHYIKAATNRIREEKGAADFCVSVFTDNSGGIVFDDNYIISDKVETHNSPSALDPFGGAITGIVGVNRDAIGFGMAAKPIANRYGFCFGDPEDTAALYRKKGGDAMLQPRKIMDGVIRGVNAGGNTSGIPTPQGFVYFDNRYRGKPLVFVGTVGLSPSTVNGAPFTEKRALPGDNIVVAGGRVGMDGIHGATFSSESLNLGSPSTAVQIGDPITQKKLSDAIVKEARDMGLYHSITDNGAGGLSCSVAEMARESGGFEVNLDDVLLKYPGMAPWQIWISESQERMTLAIPDNSLKAFFELMESRGVEVSKIGRFTSSGRGVVISGSKKIFDMDMEFLHEGLPVKILVSSYEKPAYKEAVFGEPDDMNNVFIKMVSRLNTCGFEFISSQYDHEVQGASVIKPLQGKGRVNGSASSIKPVFDSPKAVILSHGLYPSYSELDPYRMAACSIDTAVRGAIAAGGSLDVLALLDNFCWCDSNNPARLGQLKEAARACYDTAVAYGTPFISGKDSMFNDFSGYDETGNKITVSIPPTLLISSISVTNDWRNCQSLDFKKEGDFIYLIGATRDETGGSEYLALMEQSGGNVPDVDAASFVKNYRAFERAMPFVASAISLERGGLGVALAKSAVAALLGCSIDLSRANTKLRNDILLFSESQGRILCSVAPQNKKDFESLLEGTPCVNIGEVTGSGKIEITSGGATVISLEIDEAAAAYKGVFAEF